MASCFGFGEAVEIPMTKTTLDDPKISAPTVEPQADEVESALHSADLHQANGVHDDLADSEELDEEADEELDEEFESEAQRQRDPRRAAFLDDLPDALELKPLVAAFVEGNYALLRRLEGALSIQGGDPEVLAAARELVARTAPDPLAKKLLGLSVGFFLLIVGWVYLHHAH